MRHDRCWHEDMKWYGPAGIGTTYGIDGFIEHHQRPFLTAFPDRKGGYKPRRAPLGGQLRRFDRLAECRGDPTPETAGWDNRPAIEESACESWISGARDGDKLRENWVLIDIPELLLQMDVDLFGLLDRQQVPSEAGG